MKLVQSRCLARRKLPPERLRTIKGLVAQDWRVLHWREYTTKSESQNGFVGKIGTWIGGTSKK